MGRAYKVLLDRLVSDRSGIHIRKVSRVLNALYDVLLDELVTVGEATIPSVGTLRKYTAKVNRDVVLQQGHFTGRTVTARIRVRNHVRIYFSKATKLRDALKETNMDKLGVDESVDQETLEKHAAQGCPLCGSPVEKHGHVIACPKHGTEPFEKEADGRKETHQGRR